jgi:hypothetical protein
MPESYSHPFKAISGETTQHILCVVFPSSLPGGPIVLEDFFGNLKDMNPGSITQMIE